MISSPIRSSLHCNLTSTHTFYWMLGAFEYLIDKSSGYFPFIIFLDLSAKSNTVNQSLLLPGNFYVLKEKCPGSHHLYLTIPLWAPLSSPPSNCWCNLRFYLLCIHLLLIYIFSLSSLTTIWMLINPQFISAAWTSLRSSRPIYSSPSRCSRRTSNSS